MESKGQGIKTETTQSSHHRRQTSTCPSHRLVYVREIDGRDDGSEGRVRPPVQSHLRLRGRQDALGRSVAGERHPRRSGTQLPVVAAVIQGVAGAIGPGLDEADQAIERGAIRAAKYPPPQRAEARRWRLPAGPTSPAPAQSSRAGRRDRPVSSASRRTRRHWSPRTASSRGRAFHCLPTCSSQVPPQTPAS